LKLAVGVLLLTFITAITTGFYVYHFMFSLTEKMKTSFPIRPLSAEFNINTTCLTVFIKNFASVNVQIMEAYVNGEEYCLTEEVVIPPGDVGTIYLHGTFVEGEIYTVKIVSSLGSTLILNVKCDL